MKVLKFATLTLLLALSTAVFAGGGRGTVGGGGGVVWQCEAQANQAKTYLADVALLETATLNAEIFNSIETGGINYLVEMLNSRSPGLGDAVKQRIDILIFKETTDTLDLLNDDGLPLHEVINGNFCTKAQLAKQTFDTGVVEYNIALFQAMSPADRVIFKVHEGLVSLLERQFGSTAPIRAEILTAVNANLLNDLDSLYETHSVSWVDSVTTNYAGYVCQLDQLKNHEVAKGFENYTKSQIKLYTSGHDIKMHRKRPNEENNGVLEMTTAGQVTAIENLSPGSAEFTKILQQFGDEQTSGMSPEERAQVTFIKIYHTESRGVEFDGVKPLAAPEMIIRFFSATKQVGGSVLELLPNKKIARVCMPNQWVHTKSCRDPQSYKVTGDFMLQLDANYIPVAINDDTVIGNMTLVSEGGNRYSARYRDGNKKTFQYDSVRNKLIHGQTQFDCN